MGRRSSTLLYRSIRSSSSSILKQVHLFSLLLLLQGCNQVMFSVEGRPVLKLQEFAKAKRVEMVGVAMIGSRPPRCAEKCVACGRCEAVQVPAGPQQAQTRAGHISAAAASGNDDDSNSVYKPLSWKCKCGGVILNP